MKKTKIETEISKTKIRKSLMTILQLVESKQYPAYRVITDFVTQIIYEFDYDLGKWADKICGDYYFKRDKK